MSHTHNWQWTAKVKMDDSFSFHSQLPTWLSQFTDIPKDSELDVYEISCGDVTCPTQETLFVWLEDSKKREFRISRKKENISKMDVQLSWNRWKEKGFV